MNKEYNALYFEAMKNIKEQNVVVAIQLFRKAYDIKPSKDIKVYIDIYDKLFVENNLTFDFWDV